MVQLSDTVISRSRKEHLCGVCNVIMPKGSMQRVYTWIDEDSSCYCTMRICMTCDMADYIDRINDSWSSEDGAPLGWAGGASSAVRFESDGLQNYLLDEVSEETDDRFRAALRRQLTINTGNNWLADWDKKEEDNEPEDNQLRLF